MRNEYVSPEIIEVGRADDVILSTKDDGAIDDGFPVHPASELDD